MDSKAQDNECRNETEQHTGCSKDGLLNRRKYLMLSAAAVGAVGAGASATPTAASGAAERNGITFDRVVDANADLGIGDGDLVDDALGNVAKEGDTLVQFPPGEYLVRDTIIVSEDNFGVESSTGNREDVVFKPVSGTYPTLFNVERNLSGLYVGSVTLDRRDEWDSSMALMRGLFSDGVYVHDIEITGWAPENTDSIAKFSVTDPDGTALIDGVTQHGPIQYGAYPNGTTLPFYNGYSTKGTITYRNIDLRAASESGIYAGKAYGDIRVEDSYFKNCAHSAVRVTGEGSWVKNTTIVMDIDDLHPESEVTDPEGIELNRGIWPQSADHEHAGPLIEDCDIIINNAGPGIAGILSAADSGGVEVRNTRIECNQDDIWPILIQEESASRAGKPYEALLDGVSITGEGSGKPAVEIRGRDGTTVKDSCIHMPNGDGIEFDGTSDGTIENTNVNVGGRATIFDNADVVTTNLTSNESCPAVQLDSWNSEDSSSGSDDSDSDTSDGSDTTDGSSGNEDTTTDPVTSGNQIVVAQVREGEVVRYDLTASDGLTAGEHANVEPDGNTVSERVGSLRGVDNFYLDGYVTDFNGGSFDYANVYFADDGVDVDVDNYVLQNPEDLREVDPAVLGQNVLTVESDNDQASGFELSVSGDVEPGATGDGVTVTDGIVNGSTTDLAAFHFTGDVDDIAVTDPETVTVTVNGSTVDTADLSTVGGEDLPNAISFVGTGSATSYSFTVSEEIEAGSSPNDDIVDNISSSSAEGAIETGTHVYDFSGELTDLTVTGDIEVYLNGEPIAEGSDDRHLMIFDGSNDDEVSSYKFAVSGSVESSPEYTVAADGSWDALESKVEEDSAVGLVQEGKDAYWFSGYIEELELRGSAVATFETVE